jgi:hypothetical protein
MRSSHAWVWFLGIAAVACTPDWARPVKDAGADTGELEGDENDGGTESEDAAEPLLDAAGNGGLGEAGAPEADAAPRDASTDSATDAVAVTGDAGVDGGCGEGYLLQDGACRDIDECFEGTHACHMTATCENTQGSYDCKCPLGYSGGTNAGFACAPRIAVGGDLTGGGGGGHKCALLTDGTVRCWGSNTRGQLGDGTQSARTAPVVVSELQDAVMISAGAQSTCAVVLDGTLRCWGDNTRGQLGVGTMMDQVTPVQIPQLMDIVSVSVGGLHTCVVLANGTVKCWGSNNGGQVGAGSSSTAPILSPNGVKGVVGASTVFAYNNQTCAVLRDGAAQCWGDGFLGDASTSSSLTPVNVKAPRNIVSIAIGPFHACSLHGDRLVYCWGPSALGGNNTMGAVNQDPSFVLSTTAVALGIGVYSTCIIQPDGTMAWWDAGTKPAPVNGISHAIAMSSFGTDVCEVHVDGSVSCWTIINAQLTSPATVGGLDLW